MYLSVANISHHLDLDIFNLLYQLSITSQDVSLAYTWSTFSSIHQCSGIYGPFKQTILSIMYLNILQCCISTYPSNKHSIHYIPVSFEACIPSIFPHLKLKLSSYALYFSWLIPFAFKQE